MEIWQHKVRELRYRFSMVERCLNFFHSSRDGFLVVSNLEVGGHDWVCLIIMCLILGGKSV